MTRWTRWIRPALWAAALAWALAWLFQALQRWRLDRLADMAFGPYVPVEMLEQVRRATDWRTPLWTALAPLAVLALAWAVARAWRWWAARRRAGVALSSPP